MGDEFTVPDLLLGHCSSWASHIGWTVEDENLSAYFDRLKARPAFLKTKAQREAA